MIRVLVLILNTQQFSGTIIMWLINLVNNKRNDFILLKKKKHRTAKSKVKNINLQKLRSPVNKFILDYLTRLISPQQVFAEVFYQDHYQFKAA